MAIRYRCKRCGHVLFEFSKVGQDFYGIPTPEEVYRFHGGICPRCKSLLEIPREQELWLAIQISPPRVRGLVPSRLAEKGVAET